VERNEIAGLDGRRRAALADVVERQLVANDHADSQLGHLGKA
jgi:hypothetical protein